MTEMTLLRWDDRPGDPLADTRALVEQLKRESSVRAVPCLLTSGELAFIKKHEQTPCCSDRWFLYGLVKVCSSCLHSVASIMAAR